MTGLRREVRIPVYWMIVGLVVMVVSPLLAILASVTIAGSNEDRARADARQRSCSLFSSLLDTYDETPPTTSAGKNVRETYLDFYNENGCQPPRK